MTYLHIYTKKNFKSRKKSALGADLIWGDTILFMPFKFHWVDLVPLISIAPKG